MSQYDISYHPNDSYLKIKSVGENAKKWELLCIVNENVKSIIIMKNNMKISLKIRNKTIM